MEKKVFLALYKGRRGGLKGLADTLVRLATKSPYSHCEIAVRAGDSYACYSASLRDGGVRMKVMALPPERWDLIPVPDPKAAEGTASLFAATCGQGYDLAGVLGIKTPVRHRSDKWFCSEWCAAALGLDCPEKHTPASLADSLADKVDIKGYTRDGT